MTVALFALAVVLVIGFLFFNKIRREEGVKEANQQTANVKVDVLLQNATQLDRDEDGLRDWEETLWGSDPENPDSDGDGTPDGEEVASNRNPAVAGPDDALYEGLVFEQKYPEEQKPLTATDVLGRALFGEYVTRSQGGALSNDDKEKLVRDVLNRSIEPRGEKLYEVKSLYVISDTGSGDALLRTYGNAMGAIINKHHIEEDTELEIVNSALQTQNRAELKRLDPILDSYNGVIDDALLVPVPAEVADLHLRLINNFVVVIGAVEHMQAVFEDPITALYGFQSYKLEVTKLYKTLSDIETFFEDRNIIFDKEENGYLFVHILELSG